MCYLFHVGFGIAWSCTVQMSIHFNEIPSAAFQSESLIEGVHLNPWNYYFVFSYLISFFILRLKRSYGILQHLNLAVYIIFRREVIDWLILMRSIKSLSRLRVQSCSYWVWDYYVLQVASLDVQMSQELHTQLSESEKGELKESFHHLLKWAWRYNKNLEEQAAQLHMLTSWSQIVEVSCVCAWPLNLFCWKFDIVTRWLFISGSCIKK